MGELIHKINVLRDLKSRLDQHIIHMEQYQDSGADNKEAKKVSTVSSND